MSNLRKQFIEAAYAQAEAMGLDTDEARQYVIESVQAAEARGDL